MRAWKKKAGRKRRRFGMEVNMIKFGKGVVKLRIPILILSILLLIPAGLGYLNTRVNYDILTYLPEDIETMQGQDILAEGIWNRRVFLLCGRGHGGEGDCRHAGGDRRSSSCEGCDLV